MLLVVSSSNVVEAARELAARAHADQFRKSGGLPYFSHLEAVAGLVQAHGHGEDTVVAAAYLHDLLEDRPAFTDEFRERMPPAVVAIVEALSETKHDELGRKLPKSVRFERYLSGLSEATPVTDRALPISCADKVHNVSSLLSAQSRGEQLLWRLNTRPGEQLVHLSRLRRLYARAVSASLLAEFDRLHAELRRTVERCLFGRAAMIAAEAHLNQFDKAGEPYILHPLALALRTKQPDERIVAVLHDVVEDGDVTLDALAREGFPEHIVRAVDALTKRNGEDYDGFIARVAKDRLATRVKLLDLEHNSDLTRIPDASAADLERVQKYRRAGERLRAELLLRNLELKLSAPSVECVRRAARLPILRGEHVTLARRVDPNGNIEALVPNGHRLGERIAFRAVAECCDERVQTWVVELAGSSVRPWDGGVLHITVSRAEGARSKDSNDLLQSGARAPLAIDLEGELVWV
jgi:hypothetical protein